MLAKIFSIFAKPAPELSIADQLGLQLLAMMKNTQTLERDVIKFIKDNQIIMEDNGYTAISMNAINFDMSDAQKTSTPSILARTQDFQKRMPEAAALINKIKAYEISQANNRNNPNYFSLSPVRA